MKDEDASLMKLGDIKLLIKFNMWCAWYRQINQGRLPANWAVVFYEKTIDAFDTNKLNIGIKISKGNFKDDAESTLDKNIDNKTIYFRLKFSKFPDFDRRNDQWINFQESLNTQWKQQV